VRGHAALTGQGEAPLGALLPEHAPDGCRVANIALDTPHPVAKVLDVLETAPPAVDAEDLDVAPGDEIIGQVAAHETGESRDQDAHHESPSKKPRTAAMTASI